MNMVDVLAILPYYVELGMKMDDMNNKHPLLDNPQQFHNMTVRFGFIEQSFIVIFD